MPDTPASSWSIQSQTTHSDVVNGTVVDGYLVHFLTGEGHPGQVFVPMRQYRPDTVRAMIQDAANNIDAVGALTGDGNG